MIITYKGSFIVKKNLQWVHAKCFAEFEDEGITKNKCCRCLEKIDAEDQIVGQYGAVRGWFHNDCLRQYEDRTKGQSRGGEGKSLGSDYY